MEREGKQEKGMNVGQGNQRLDEEGVFGLTHHGSTPLPVRTAVT